MSASVSRGVKVASHLPLFVCSSSAPCADFFWPCSPPFWATCARVKLSCGGNGCLTKKRNTADLHEGDRTTARGY